MLSGPAGLVRLAWLKAAALAGLAGPAGLAGLAGPARLAGLLNVLGLLGGYRKAKEMSYKYDLPNEGSIWTIPVCLMLPMVSICFHKLVRNQ